MPRQENTADAGTRPAGGDEAYGANSVPEYKATARRILTMIESGTARPGDRLPSLRQISRQNNISLSTALQAYRWLEERELIFSRPGSGFFVAGEPPASVRLRTPPYGTDAEASRHVTRPVEPDWILPCAPHATLMPSRRLSRIIGGIARRHPGLIADSGPVCGDAELRRQIARHSMTYGCGHSASDIVMTSGGMEAISLAVRAVTAPGDMIAVESPCSSAVLGIIRHARLRPVEVTAIPGEGISLAHLETVLNEHDIGACLFSTHCSDPLGYVMADSHKRALVALLEARKIPLIENDILGDLAFGTRPRPAGSFSKRDNVLLCSSFAFTLGWGLRLGWVFPGRYSAQVRQLKVASSITAPILLQRAVAEYLRGSAYDRHLSSLRRALERQAGQHSHSVTRHFPPGTCIHQPDGGAALWVELPEGIDTETLHEQAVDLQLDVAPGSRFTQTGNLMRFLRLGVGGPWTAEIDNRIRRLGLLADGLLHHKA